MQNESSHLRRNGSLPRGRGSVNGLMFAPVDAPDSSVPGKQTTRQNRIVRYDGSDQTAAQFIDGVKILTRHIMHVPDVGRLGV